jgi:hypothetical protein
LEEVDTRWKKWIRVGRIEYKTIVNEPDLPLAGWLNLRLRLKLESKVINLHFHLTDSFRHLSATASISHPEEISQSQRRTLSDLLPPPSRRLFRAALHLA